MKIKPGIKSVFTVLIGAVLAGCASQSAEPRLQLQQQYPDAKVIGIGQLMPVDDQRNFESKPINQKRSDELTYPARALNQGRAIQGCVVVELLVDADGSVKRTAVAEAYPRGYFNRASLREARKLRYREGGQQVVTYHRFSYRVDQSQDMGLEEIFRMPGFTELLHLNRIPTDPGIPEGYTGSTSRLNDVLPKQCENIADRYINPALPKRTAAEPE